MFLPVLLYLGYQPLNKLNHIDNEFMLLLFIVGLVWAYVVLQTYGF